MTTVNVTASGTWTCPAGCLYIDLYMKGGGAAGEGGGAYDGGDGGGEGAVVNESLYAVTPGVVYQLTYGGTSTGTGNPCIFKDQNGNPLKTATGGVYRQVPAPGYPNGNGADGEGTYGGAGGQGNYPSGTDGAAGTLGCGVRVVATPQRICGDICAREGRPS